MSNPERKYSWEPAGFDPSVDGRDSMIRKIDDVLAEPAIPVAKLGSPQAEPFVASENSHSSGTLPHRRDQYTDTELVILYSSNGDLARGERRLARKQARQATYVLFEGVGTAIQASWGTYEAFAGRPSMAIALGIGTVVAGGMTGATEYFRRSTKQMRHQMHSLRQRHQPPQS